MSGRMEYPGAEAGNVEGLPVFERLVVPDLPFCISRVHVYGCSGLTANKLEGVDVVGVPVRHEDGRNGSADRAQYLLRLCPGVDDDIAPGGMDDVGVDLEAVHGDGDLFYLTHRVRILALEGCPVAGDPVDVVDIWDAPDLADYLLHVLHARGLEREAAQGGTIFDGIDSRREDVHAGVRDRRRDVLQQVHTVEGLHEQLDRKELV